MSKRILLALTSNGDLGGTGRRTGFYVPEAAHPYRVFRDAGFAVDFVSVLGGEPPRDGYDEGDPVQKDFLEREAERLRSTPAPAAVDPGGYDAVFYVGGHGTMWDLPEAVELAGLAAAVYERGGVVAAVCHGPAGLVGLTLSDGSHLVAGKRVSSFTNEEEAAVGLDTVVPFLLQTRLEALGAKWEGGPAFAEYAVADRRLVTGQNPASAVETARLVVDELS